MPVKPQQVVEAEDWQSQIKNDKVKVIAKYPQIPVGGRLSKFLKEWEKITTDKWVLEVIREGYKLEFLEKPPFLGVKPTRVPEKNQKLIKAEIDSLLEKNAIEIVQSSEIQTGFYSTLFLVPKKNGELRPVINLKPLNRYLRKQHFKMDTMTKVLNLVEPGDWGLTIDLKDAYFHIKIYKGHRKYLRFQFQGIVYQFRALCFGPTSAPRVFTKIVSVVVAWLRQRSIRIASYLDDWLALNRLQQGLLQNRVMLLNLLFRLGFMINKQKSNLVPRQLISYIGGQFNLKQGLVFPTEERLLNLKIAVLNIVKGQNTARHFLIVLGMIASCLELIPHGRLFMRPLQLHLLQNWSPARMSLNCQVPVTPQLISDLQWWLQDHNIAKGRLLRQTSCQVTVTTDASGTWGWGGHMDNLVVQGQWSDLEKMEHINCLEMKAVIYTLQRFLSHLRNKAVMIRSDNTTVVQYINKQGGTRSPYLCQLTMTLWLLAIQNNMTLKAAHIMGKKNVLADALSRQSISLMEWELNSTVVHQIFSRWGQPLLDLFATYQNKKTLLYCSWIPDPQAYAQDALSIAWENMFVYAFPPLQLIPKVLKHFQMFNCKMILIAPHWPRQHWFPQVLQLLIAQPVKLPQFQNLLSQKRGKLLHPQPQSLQLTAWLLSTKSSHQKAFQRTLESCWQPLGGREHKKTTNVNLGSSIAGVVNNKLIHFQLL